MLIFNKLRCDCCCAICYPFVLQFIFTLLLMSPMSAFASSSAISLGANVLSNCMFASGDHAMSFGEYDPTRNVVATPLTSATTFTLRCSKGSAASISLSGGLYAEGGKRRMRSGLDSYLKYNLFKDPSRQSIWNDANKVNYAASSSAPQTFTVYGAVEAGQNNVAIGSYSDTITINVFF